MLDILILIGLLTALAFNYAGKRALAEGQEPDGSVSRRNLEINIAFYLTAGVTILFLPQLVFIACPGSRKPGGQPSGVDNLGSRRHDAAAGPGNHRLPNHEGEIMIKPNRETFADQRRHRPPPTGGRFGVKGGGNCLRSRSP